jgi:Putative adhesin
MRLTVCLLLTSFAGIAGANECRFTAERNFDIDPAGLQSLALKLGSSDAVVEGVAGLTKIEVRGKACASQEDWLAGLTVSQSRSGDSATVAPEQTHHSGNWFGSSYAYVDLHIRMPAKLALQIRSASGDADVSEVAALDFHGSSGDLKARHIAGNVTLQVSSGDVIVEDVGGIDLPSSSSGDIKVSQVHGAVKVGRVGSGDLRFVDVHDGVAVEAIGSGDVTVERIGGDVRIGKIGSGDVNADGVGGNFTVVSGGNGDIHPHNVKGRVDVPNRRAD